MLRPLRGGRERTEGEGGGGGGGLNVWMYRAFNRTSYITGLNQRWSGGGNACRFVTSYGERAVVSLVYDETVHVQGDRRGLGVGGIVTGAVILQQRQQNVDGV